MVVRAIFVNSMAPRRCDSDFESMNFFLVLHVIQNSSLGSRCELLPTLTDDKSISVKGMA